MTITSPNITVQLVTLPLNIFKILA